jgi:hypothetical protein
MCFSLEWLKDLLIWLVVVAAVVAIVRLLLPMVLAPLGPPATMVLQVVNIIVWAFVAIVVIVFAFDALMCLPRIH